MVVVGAELSTEAVSPPYAKRTRQGRGSSSSFSCREWSPEAFSIWAADNMYQLSSALTKGLGLLKRLRMEKT